MNEALRKVKNSKRILRTQELRRDQESALLADIRRLKDLAVEESRSIWRQYMAGVEKINRMRQEGQTAVLPTLEGGLDFLIQRWKESREKVRQIENDERVQFERVVGMQGDVRKTEKLQERHVDQYNRYQKKAEQKSLDEFNTRRFGNDEK